MKTLTLERIKNAYRATGLKLPETCLTYSARTEEACPIAAVYQHEIQDLRTANWLPGMIEELGLNPQWGFGFVQGFDGTAPADGMYLSMIRSVYGTPDLDTYNEGYLAGRITRRELSRHEAEDAEDLLVSVHEAENYFAMKGAV